MSGRISHTRLVLIGHFLINLPTLIIIFSVRELFIAISTLKAIEAGILGIIAGWIYWHFAIKRWIRWGYYNNYSPQKLLSIGRRNLFLWNKSTIDGAI